MDLREAADRLGVHYQTAYRWVRHGDLAAYKVGSTYQIDDDEVRRFELLRAQPLSPPRVTQVRSWDAQVERLYGLLLAGDDLTARQLVDRLHAGGVEPCTLCEELLAPALERVGAGWAEGRVSVAEEHRASAICERLLVRITLHPRGRPRGVAVVSTPIGDAHGLPASMAAVCLRADRWRVHHLGTEVPPDDLVRLAVDAAADVVVLSTVFSPAGSARSVVRRLEDHGINVLVGGPGGSLRDLLAQARKA